jgi:hypothetical protein
VYLIIVLLFTDNWNLHLVIEWDFLRNWPQLKATLTWLLFDSPDKKQQNDSYASQQQLKLNPVSKKCYGYLEGHNDQEECFLLGSS